jgi:hypothetical protein
MKSFLIGIDEDTGRRFYLPKSSFDTHWHLIGGTGKGKTTAIKTVLHQIMMDPLDRPCVVVIDRMGGLSHDLLLWMASEYCPPAVRDRLVYIEPAREDVVLGFNPLVCETEGRTYYKVTRAAELILRGWASQDLKEMPRLARWLFNSFYACALIGLTIADSVHLLLPRSRYHPPILRALPDRLQDEWAELNSTHSGEVARQLESARNRLKPFYEAPALRQMFGATTNRLDMCRFMREGKIVIVNLKPGGVIPEQIADAIGGMVINEVLATARSLPPQIRYPTYLFLDEFQRFVGPDVEAAIPEVRQLGIKLILGHQSFSQLKQGDLDLTTMIFQAQSRMIFGVQGEDADLLAHEMASLQYDPQRIKEEIYSRRQRISGHSIAELNTWGQAEAHAENWNRSYGNNWARGQTRRGGIVVSEQESRGITEARGNGGSATHTVSRGAHQQLVPIHEDYWELVNRVYWTFDEDRHVWGRDIRELLRGHAFVRVVDVPRSHRVHVKHSAPGHLALTPQQLEEFYPKASNDVERLIASNFTAEWFVSPKTIEAETEARLQRILTPPITVHPRGPGVDDHESSPSSEKTPFP